MLGSIVRAAVADLCVDDGEDSGDGGIGGGHGRVRERGVDAPNGVEFVLEDVWVGCKGGPEMAVREVHGEIVQGGVEKNGRGEGGGEPGRLSGHGAPGGGFIVSEVGEKVLVEGRKPCWQNVEGIEMLG